MTAISATCPAAADPPLRVGRHPWVAAVDVLPQPLAIVDLDGTVIHVNAAGRRLEGLNDWIPWRSLRLGRRCVVPCAQGKRVLTVDPLGQGLLLIRLVEIGPASGVDYSSLLEAIHGLTLAESRLATELAVGASPRDIALRTGVSMHTVRSQLSAIFSKTGTRRQSQLVSLILRYAPLLRAG